MTNIFPLLCRLAITKRIHRNDLEHLVTVVPLSMANGLLYPWWTVGLLSAYFGGRRLFTDGYQEKEGAFNTYRMAGSITVNVVHLATMLTTVFAAVQLIRGKKCLAKVLTSAAPKQ